MLKTVVLPEGTTSIRSNAIGGCWSLESITVPASVKEFSENAFVNFNGKTVIITPSGSAAETFAKANNFSVKNQ
jgi:hypothetical protein